MYSISHYYQSGPCTTERVRLNGVGRGRTGTNFAEEVLTACNYICAGGHPPFKPGDLAMQAERSNAVAIERGRGRRTIVEVCEHH